MYYWHTEDTPTEKKAYLCTIKTEDGYKLKRLNYPFKEEVVAWTEYPAPYIPDDLDSMVTNDLHKRFTEMIAKERDEYNGGS